MIRSSLQSPSQPLAQQRLSDQLADDLRRQIEAGLVQPGARLPTEQAAGAAQYAVSRTVVREAVSRLRSQRPAAWRARVRACSWPRRMPPSRWSSTAACWPTWAPCWTWWKCAARWKAKWPRWPPCAPPPPSVATIQAALALADASIASGSATVDEDLAFHQAVAEAAGNPQFARLLRHLEQYLREAMTVTRRNESMKQEFITQVRQEHQAIVDAILARDADAARAAAARHMHEAACAACTTATPPSAATRPRSEGQTP
jgi:GntR family transcriptional repressor for pyruvate dehydrogenase complex